MFAALAHLPELVGDAGRLPMSLISVQTRQAGRAQTWNMDSWARKTPPRDSLVPTSYVSCAEAGVCLCIMPSYRELLAACTSAVGQASVLEGAMQRNARCCFWSGMRASPRFGGPREPCARTGMVRSGSPAHCELLQARCTCAEVRCDFGNRGATSTLPHIPLPCAQPRKTGLRSQGGLVA